MAPPWVVVQAPIAERGASPPPVFILPSLAGRSLARRIPKDEDMAEAEDMPEENGGAAKGTFTGVTRERSTRRSVVIADKLSRLFITVGGIGTIIAVLGVAVFLVWVVVPLFLPAKVESVEAFPRDSSEEVVHVAVDEYKVLTWVLRPSGKIEVLRLDDGERLDELQVFANGQLVSASFLIRGDLAAFGLADGSVQLAEIGFDTKILDADQMPAAVIAALEADPGTPVSHDRGVVELTPTGQYRVQQLKVEMGKLTRISSGPVHLIEHVVRSDGPLVVAIAEGGAPLGPAAEEGAPSPADTGTGEELFPPAESPAPDPAASPAGPAGSGGLRLVAISGAETSNFLTGERTVEFSGPVDLPFDSPPRQRVPSHLALNGSGSDVMVAWQDGMMMRIRRSETQEAFVAEQGTLLPTGGTLAVLDFVLGNTTVLWGDQRGVVRGGFTVPRADLGDDVQGLRNVRLEERSLEIFAKTKDLSEQGATPTALASSARSRLILVGFEDGEIRLYNVTNATELGTFRLPDGPSGPEPVLKLAMAPKEDGLLAVTPTQFYRTDFNVRHPEASTKALFRPVWYEGYNKAQHTWQSSSATDDFEMKLGLWPLIFGTLKATFYSMLFGAPLALLAAVYTSEFLNHRVKAVIKPGIELMASLPSVVLGFLAALVFAPYIEKIVPTSLAIFIGIPVAFLLGAYIWQLLPVRVAMLYDQWRFPLMVLALVPGLWAGFQLGPLGEAWLFGGDIKAWLAWEPGVRPTGAEGAERYASSVGGWMLLTLPLSGVAVLFGLGRFVDPLMRARGAYWDRRTYALVDLAKFLVGIGVTLLLALAVSALLDGMGLDPRGAYIDTYVQRNALIVGFVMGFAIIPIIYTISEDALSTVPEHLRSASLGAGATQWQTATRIIIPTAMSGLFSALMIGLGRAVGETMIVLMAAGNTPVLEWNIFNGFRTLSANIAVELPEAVQGSTHYRTLFLAALVLFVMTFIVNTVAEVIRLRFRKRAYQL